MTQWLRFSQKSGQLVLSCSGQHPLSRSIEVHEISIIFIQLMFINHIHCWDINQIYQSDISIMLYMNQQCSFPFPKSDDFRRARRRAAQSEMSNWQRGLPTNPRSFTVSPRSFISFMVHGVHIQQFLCPQLSWCLVWFVGRHSLLGKHAKCAFCIAKTRWSNRLEAFKNSRHEVPQESAEDTEA